MMQNVSWEGAISPNFIVFILKKYLVTLCLITLRVKNSNYYDIYFRYRLVAFIVKSQSKLGFE